jgi:hypothetical protein
MALPKFERAASTMMNRGASVGEKHAAAKIFLGYFVTYLSLLAVVGVGGSMLLRRIGPTSPLGLPIGIGCFLVGLAIMIAFVRSSLRAIFARRDNIAERDR